MSGLLNLVDLAGSERLSKSGTTGDRLKETQVIFAWLHFMRHVSCKLIIFAMIVHIAELPSLLLCAGHQQESVVTGCALYYLSTKLPDKLQLCTLEIAGARMLMVLSAMQVM